MSYIRLPAPRGFHPGLVAVRPRGYLPGMSGLGACASCRGGLLAGLGSLLGSLELGLKESKLAAAKEGLAATNANITNMINALKLAPIRANPLRTAPISFWQSLTKTKCVTSGSGRSKSTVCSTQREYAIRQPMIDALTTKAKLEQEIPLLEREVAHLRDLEAAKTQQQAVQQATQNAINQLPGSAPALGPIPTPNTPALPTPADPALIKPQMPSLMPAQPPIINYVSPQPLPVTANEIRDTALAVPQAAPSSAGPLLAAGGVAAAAYLLFG